MTDENDASFNQSSHVGYSNASKTLGMDITFADRVEGVIEANFEAKECFQNTVGNIQGGILVAMLDDLMGYALGITLPNTQFAPTANLNASFLRPVSSGVLKGKGQVLKRDGKLFYLASKLFNESGDLIASATARAKLGDIGS